MADFEIPNEVLNKIINLGGVEKLLYCDKCGQYIKHVSVSYSQMSAVRQTGLRLADQVFGRIMDHVPFAMPLTYGNPYACTSCRRINFEGGLASDTINHLRKKAERNSPDWIDRDRL